MIRAAIHGHPGGDPVQRETRNGKAMTTVSVAVNVAKPSEDPVIEWIAFGATAELLAKHAKGDVISAMGPLTCSTFTGRDGRERSAWSLGAEAILSVRRTTRNELPQQPHDTNTSTRARRARSSANSLFSTPKGPRHTIPDLPDDGVQDLYR